MKKDSNGIQIQLICKLCTRLLEVGTSKISSAYSKQSEEGSLLAEVKYLANIVNNHKKIHSYYLVKKRLKVCKFYSESRKREANIRLKSTN